MDYHVIGSGLTGSTIARILTDNGNSVTVFERRNHIAGNVFDYFDRNLKIIIHKYGPHYFRTSDDEVWNFLKKFTDFFSFKAQIKSNINGKLENWPISYSYIKNHVGDNWKECIKKIDNPSNFEELALCMMPQQVYDLFVKEYNEKQWNAPCNKLSKDLISRFDVREDNNPFLTPYEKYQGVPKRGYTKMVERMLRGITVYTNVDYIQSRSIIKPPRKKIIFTGPIDEWYNFKLGRLRYRSQNRETRQIQKKDFYQPVIQVNYPLWKDGDHIRIIEWKHLMTSKMRIKGTVITTETPCDPRSPDEYEYPFPDEKNKKMYKRYKMLAQDENNVLFCGRLGKYQYIDMNHTIKEAIQIANKLVKGD